MPQRKTKSPKHVAPRAAKAILRQIAARARSPQFRRHLKDLLVELCRVDTTPHSDVSVMRAAEDKVFGILERELAKVNFAGAR
ncbi:MAG: hypothetical protein N2689_13840, partial [Verrucomicrobiae bacterium]|nr:hypothetical protein [Verrucomicrobiae bacterium]